ncbi:hypothetical protein BDF20DRAFT_811412 [Mycotypha africana]|uniref:uncharacterized protein n=1 Tax=Mycotypha africana TaxID=64632 RepID=UPI0023014F55|nr:uncharacterized protein BDF20DRAFT_811412 [Mycotypha africana]KAI8991605.1 hypothetical protein BDF20DRAFT_811412 [Mycotypha africana]
MKKAPSILKTINSPLPTSLVGECKKAAKILNSFIDPGQGLDKIIPNSILEKAQGLAIFTVLKAGFLFSGRVGSGLVVARLPDNSWSAPSAIVTGGMGAGGQIGAELTDFILVLNNKEAVKTFSHFGNITLGTNVSIAAGPIGRNAEASGSATLKHIAAIYSYSKTRGLFAGVSLEGSVIITRNDANEKLYGERYTAKELLNGTVPPPREADVLYRALNAKFPTAPPPTSTLHSYQQPSSPIPSSTKAQEAGFDAPHNALHFNNDNKNTTYSTNTYNNDTVTNVANTNSTYNHYNSHSSPHGLPPAYDGQQINFAQEIKRTVPPPPPSQTLKPIRARTLYDYTSEQPGDLSFKAGDIIIVVEKTDSQNDWWTGKLNGRTGAFPSNYVELMN